MSPVEREARQFSCAVRRGEAKERLDPHFHTPTFRYLEKQITRRPHLPLSCIVRQSSEMWDRKSVPGDAESIRYLEIASVGLGTGEYALETVPATEAPSRARMVLRGGDIVVSTTRPHRGAIAEISLADSGAIGSTGFAVLREHVAPNVRWDFLRNVLFSNAVLTQLLQRSSGGAYPAITPDELDRVVIPVPKANEQLRLVTLLDNAREQRKSLLDEADALLKGVDGYVLEQLGLRLPTSELHKSTYAVRLKSAAASRKLYPDFFHPERLQTIRAIADRYPGDRCATLHSIADFERSQRQARPDDNYLGLASIKSNTGERIETSSEEVPGSVFEFVENDVLFARLRPYLNKVYLAEGSGVCSPEFHVIRVRPTKNNRMSVLPGYLAAVLRSSVVLFQTRHMMTGNTHPRLADEDVKDLVIPIPDVSIQRSIVAELNRRRSAARQLRTEAERIWEQAKADFEAALFGDTDSPETTGGGK